MDGCIRWLGELLQRGAPTEATSWTVPFTLRCSCALCGAVQAFLRDPACSQQAFRPKDKEQQGHVECATLTGLHARNKSAQPDLLPSCAWSFVRAQQVPSLHDPAGCMTAWQQYPPAMP